MKRIYITGIYGMLGSNIAFNLQGKYDVTGCDLVPRNFKLIQTDNIDLMNQKQLQESISNHLPDVVVHTAAMVNVDACEMNKEQAEDLNAIVTKNLSQICSERNIKLIYISTDAVFDGETSALYTETDSTNPLNVYGITKLKGEEEVMQDARNVVLRTNIYGYNYQEKNSFGEWVLNSLMDGKELNMFDDVFFSPILVNELAQIIDKMIEQDFSGLYHACGTGAISKYEFGCHLKEIFHINSGVIHQSQSDKFPFKARRAKNMGMSNKKLSDELGIHIRTPDESIAEFKRLYDEEYYLKLKNF